MVRIKEASRVAALYGVYLTMVGLFAVGGYKIHPGLGFILPACVLFLDYHQAAARRRDVA